jgi:excisionase family DNA binding protein
MDQRIACTMTPDAFRNRTGALAALAARALHAREQTTYGERLTFTDTPDTERELREVIAEESTCCAFLNLELRRDGERLVLDASRVSRLLGPSRQARWPDDAARGLSDMTRLLTAQDVAARLGVTMAWVWAQTRAGRIPHVRLGRYRRFREEAIDEWLEQLEQGMADHRKTTVVRR